MTITIKEAASRTPLSVDELVDGHAYRETDSGIVYLCNRYREGVAYSLCGQHAVGQGDRHSMFVEVDLEVTVKGGE